jgi:acyl-CoA thioester hydrolase
VGREVAAEIRVRYADTDQMGVAYYANYLVWFEVGRNEFLRALGYPYVRLEREDLRMPVTEASCQYRSPARYDDVIDVWTSIEEMGPASVRFRYRILRRADGKVLATGGTRHASLGPEGRPRRIPDEVRKCLQG